MTRSEGDQLLAGAVRAAMEQIEAVIYFKLQTSGIGNEFSYSKDTFSERFQL